MGKQSKLFAVTMIFALLMMMFVGCSAPSPESSLLTLIRGEEDTSSLIHIVALNVKGHAANYMVQTVQGRIDEINAQGGLAIIAHPNVYGYTTEGELKALKRYLGMEVYFRWGDNALAKWDAVLTDRVRKGEPLVWGFMTDDAHKMEEFGKGFVMLRASELSKDRVLAALREGSFYWGNAPIIKDISLSGKTIAISLNNEANIKFLKQGGQVVKTTTGMSADYAVSGNEGYIRVEVETTDGKRAGTQPFRIKDALNISNPYAVSGNWYKGNLHCHSTRSSDGMLSPEEVVKSYEDNGYSFLSITDHVRWVLPGERLF